MSKQVITVIPGDGIGPEITEATLRVLNELQCPLEFDHQIAGLTAIEKGLELMPQATLDSIAKNGVALKGPLTTPIGRGFTSLNVMLRKHFDLYANVRPAITRDGIKSHYSGVNIVLVRENTEGMYCGEGQIISEDGERAEAKSVITKQGSKRVLEFAYDLALRQQRKKVAVVHKANILKSTSGMFLSTSRDVREQYPNIETVELIVDNACMQLVVRPEQFDVIVTTNLFGDIVSDLCAGLVGGLGMAPGANIGDDVALFEAVHGSAPDIAGQGVANPFALILAASMMLDQLGMSEPAQRIRQAVDQVVADGDRLTRDLGGTAGTVEITDALIERL